MAYLGHTEGRWTKTGWRSLFVWISYLQIYDHVTYPTILIVCTQTMYLVHATVSIT